jgi:superfamily II DNA or RNA helicase
MLKTGSRRCIVYLNSREECDTFNQIFSKVCSEYHGISSWTEKIDCEVVLERRRQLLEQFQSEKTIKNTLHILSSVRILDEAVDIVKCDSEFIGSVGENSSDIRCVQRLFRGGRLDKSNINKINNLFIWSKEIPNVVNMLSLLRDSDPEFHKKVSVLDGSYDSSGKGNGDRVELKAIELKSLEKALEIKCLSLLDYHRTMLNKIKDFNEKYNEYPKNGARYASETLIKPFQNITKFLINHYSVISFIFFCFFYT